MKKGFTLVELVIVIVIVGILSIVGVREYQIQVEKARLTDAVSNLKAITDANIHYYLEHGCYQTDITKLPIEFEGIKTYSYGTNRIIGQFFTYSSASTNLNDNDIVPVTTVHKNPIAKKYCIHCSYKFDTNKYTYKSHLYPSYNCTETEKAAVMDWSKKVGATIQIQ